MQKFSFNIHAMNLSNAEKSELLDIFRREKPTTALILNDSAFASQVADIVPNTILRITNNDDEIQLKLTSFKEWWRLVKPAYTDKRLIVHFCNEPHSNFPKLSALCVEGMQVLHDEGYRGVFGNFGVGTPEPDDWTHSLKPLLQGLIDYPEMFLGLHEYLMYTPTLSIPYEISRYEQIPVKINILLTEFGFDYIDAVWQHNQSTKVRGWKDHLKYLISIGVLDPEPTMLLMLTTIFKRFYNLDDRIKGVNFFCFGNSGGWESYDAVSWNYLKDHIGEFATVTQTITKIDPVELVITAVSGAVNRREQPNTSSPIHGTLTDSTRVAKIAITNDGWSQYQFIDGAFWIRDDVIKATTQSVVTISIANASADEVEEFKNLLEQLHAFLISHDVEFS